jgi:bifunctional non-homologous end joining protein LigD
MIKPELCKDRKTFNNIDLPYYIAEKKYDGERIIAIKEGDDITLQRRSGKLATHQYPEVVEALRSFEYDIILDGEMCVFVDGEDNFQEGLSPRVHLKNEDKIYIKAIETPATYMIFDVLKGGLVDLTQKSLWQRKAYLEQFYGQSILDTPAEQHIKLIEYGTDSVDLFNTAKLNGWEGIVLKPKEAMYMQGSRKQWIKMKNTFDDDFIFTKYEENNRGIKLIKIKEDDRDTTTVIVDKKNPIVIQCTGEQSSEVKYLLDKNDEVFVTVSYLNKTLGDRLRMPVFKKLVD